MYAKPLCFNASSNTYFICSVSQQVLATKLAPITNISFTGLRGEIATPSGLVLSMYPSSVVGVGCHNVNAKT